MRFLIWKTAFADRSRAGDDVGDEACLAAGGSEAGDEGQEEGEQDADQPHQGLRAASEGIE